MADVAQAFDVPREAGQGIASSDGLPTEATLAEVHDEFDTVCRVAELDAVGATGIRHRAAMRVRLEMLELELENVLVLLADGHHGAAESAVRTSLRATQRVLDQTDDEP